MVKKLILGIAVLGIVVLLIISLIGCFNIANNEKFMFENIRECEELCSLNYEGEKAVIYEIPQKDNYIKNLKYVEFFGVEYESSELEFKMFAYVFESDSEAKKYFENATGKGSDSQTNFSASKGSRQYELVVLHEQKAYVVITPKKNMEKVENLISDKFSIKLEF